MLSTLEKSGLVRSVLGVDLAFQLKCFDSGMLTQDPSQATEIFLQKKVEFFSLYSGDEVIERNCFHCYTFAPPSPALMHA